MGRKGPSKHVKRHESPIFWPVHRKEKVWAVKTSAGPHEFKFSIPLIVVLRDVLRKVKTSKEAKMITKQGKVTIDGIARKNERFPVGLMDVVEVQDTEEAFRVIPNQNGRLILHPIKKNETRFKLCRINGITTEKKGFNQLNLHDGRNLSLKEGKSNFSLHDVIKLNLEKNEIADHVAFKPGVKAIIIGGRSQGKYGDITGLGSELGKKRTATIRTERGEVRTLIKYFFAVGSDTPMISLPGGN